MRERRAEIVGAGLAGLFAACALAQRDWKVRVHERSRICACLVPASGFGRTA